MVLVLRHPIEARQETFKMMIKFNTLWQGFINWLLAVHQDVEEETSSSIQGFKSKVFRPVVRY